MKLSIAQIIKIIVAVLTAVLPIFLGDPEE